MDLVRTWLGRYLITKIVGIIPIQIILAWTTPASLNVYTTRGLAVYHPRP